MKKKINRKPSYKKGGESWVSEKMANLPMYALGAEFDVNDPPVKNQFGFPIIATANYGVPTNKLPTAQEWTQKATGKNSFGFAVNTNQNYGKTVDAVDVNPNYGKLVTATANQKVEEEIKPIIPKQKAATKKITTPAAASTTALASTVFVKPEINTEPGVIPSVPTVPVAEAAPDAETQRMLDTYAADKASGAWDNDYNNDDDIAGFFNPYGGVDIESRIAYGAHQLGQGNTGQGILGLASGALGVGRIGVGAFAAGQRGQYIENEAQEKMRKAQIPRATAIGRDGGMIDFMQEGGQPQEQAPQGGQDQMMQQVAEALQGGANPEEVLQQLVQSGVPQEQATQMIQGIMQQLQGQEQAPQEFQKGGTLAKKLTGEYTSPLDKDDPRVNAEIEKNEFLQSPDGEITKAEGETHENGGTPVELEGGTRIVSDHLKLGASNAKHYKENFDLEVKASDTYAKVLDKFTKKSGLQKIVDEQEKVIEQLKKSEEAAQGSNISESTTNLNKQFLSQKLEELEAAKTPLEEARKALMNDVFNKQEESKPAKPQTEEFAYGGEVPQYQDGSKHQNRFDDRYKEMVDRGYTGTNNIGEMQAWMNQNYPQDVVDYYTESEQPLNASHVDDIKANYKDVFTTIGISSDKPSASYTSEEKGKMKQALGERMTPDFLKKGFNDNKKDWRFPIIQNNITAKGIQPQKIAAPALPNFYQAPQAAAETPAQAEFSEYQKQKGNGLKLMSLPNQNPMQPDSLEGALKVTRRYDRTTPMQISAEQQIGDIRAQEAQAISQINQLPEAQRGPAMVNLSLITQQNIAKTNSDVNRTNMAQDMQSQQFNAQVQMQEENARGVDLQSYENKIMRAKATTDADIRGYYNHLQKVDLANYNAVNNVNLMNQMYSNYGYDGQSVDQTQGAPQFAYTPGGLPLAPTNGGNNTTINNTNNNTNNIKNVNQKRYKGRSRRS